MQTEVSVDQEGCLGTPRVHSHLIQPPVFDSLEEYAPGFRKLVLGYDILTPPDLESVFGLTGGVSCRDIPPPPPCQVHTVTLPYLACACRTSSTEGCCWTSSTCHDQLPPVPATGHQSRDSTSVGVAPTQVQGNPLGWSCQMHCH